MNNQETLLQRFLQLTMAALLALPIVLATSWVLNRYFGSPVEQESVRAGQSVKILPASVASKPLNFEIDFVDGDLAKPQETTAVAAKPVDYTLSSGGASITGIDYVHAVDGRSEQLNFLKTAHTNHEQRALLVALDIATPFAYELVEKNEQGKSPRLVYKADSAQATIVKEFIFDEASPKVLCNLTITPKVEHLQPRIFLPGPFLDSLTYNDVQGLILNEQQELKKIPLVETTNTAWVMPGLVGVENRYFINALIADPQNFTQRAYFMRQGNDHLTAIIEGPEIKTSTTWQLTFFIGPKIHSLLMNVDPRLEDTLEFGIVAPIARLLLKALNTLHAHVHNYGWAIIILTALLSLVLMPLSLGTQKPTMTTDEYNRKLRYIEQKYKDDKDTLRRERLALMEEQTAAALPGGWRGFLSMIVNVAAGMSLWRVLSKAIELYHAPFLWIPDLSSRDPYFILATLLGIGMFLAFAGKSKDPRQWIGMGIMSALIAAFLGNFAAGIVLYIGVQVLMNSMLKPYLDKLVGVKK
jgi:YidC/Oxa1 family membrane protein insertase